MKKLLLVLVLLYSCMNWGQSELKNYKPIVNLGYQLNSHSQYYAGLEYSFVRKKMYRRTWYFVGAGVMTTEYHNKWYWMPYLDVTNTSGLSFISNRLSTHHIQPMVGISVFNAMDVGIGYSFPFREDVSNPAFKGVTMSIKLRLTNDKSALVEFFKW